jgi:beta-glucosidase
LSYAAYNYANLTLSSDTLPAGQPLTAEVDVRNTSRFDGDEVVELYLGYPQTPGAPLRALKGFQRVQIPAGQTRHLTFVLEPRDLSLVNEQGEHMIMSGNYSIFIGGGQPMEGVQGVEAKFQISGEEKLPR